MSQNERQTFIILLQDDEPTLVTHDDRYFCPVCHKLLKDPIQTSCGHRLCKNCVEIFLGPDESKMCPAQEPDCMEVRRDNVSHLDHEVASLFIFLYHLKNILLNEVAHLLTLTMTICRNSQGSKRAESLH